MKRGKLAHKPNLLREKHRELGPRQKAHRANRRGAARRTGDQMAGGDIPKQGISRASGDDVVAERIEDAGHNVLTAGAGQAADVYEIGEFEIKPGKEGRLHLGTLNWASNENGQ